MAWFWEMGESNSYQIWSTVMIQLLFGGVCSKQMLKVALDDEWVKSFSSTILEEASNQICHGRASFNSPWKRLYSCVLLLVRGFKMMVDDRTTHQGSCSLRFSTKSSKWRTWEFLRERELWSVFQEWLGLFSRKSDICTLFKVCLSWLMERLITICIMECFG